MDPEIIRIASRISTPLALGGLVCAGLLAITYAVISKLVPKVAKQEASATIRFIVGPLFILALVATILGFAGFIVDRVYGDTGREHSTNELLEILQDRYAEGNRILERLAKEPNIPEATLGMRQGIWNAYRELTKKNLDAIRTGNAVQSHEVDKNIYELFQRRDAKEAIPEPVLSLMKFNMCDGSLMYFRENEPSLFPLFPTLPSVPPEYLRRPARANEVGSEIKKGEGLRKKEKE